MRIGHGFDAHQFAPDRPLILGGVTIPHDRGLVGHSDADVLVHTIIDALLGAAALGDIGILFPSSDDRWAGASSLDLLALAVEAVHGNGHTVVNVDSTVIAEAPRLAPYVPSMRQSIASVLALSVDSVSVKATTTDGMGFTGRAEGIAAFAVVLLE